MGIREQNSNGAANITGSNTRKRVAYSYSYIMACLSFYFTEQGILYENKRTFNSQPKVSYCKPQNSCYNSKASNHHHIINPKILLINPLHISTRLIHPHTRNMTQFKSILITLPITTAYIVGLVYTQTKNTCICSNATLSIMK